MKKIMLLCAAVVAFAAGASAQNLLDNKPATNDTLFRIEYDGQTHYIMNSDVTSRERDVYQLTAAKFFELDNIHVLMGHNVSLYEKTPAGMWKSIWVQYPWQSVLPKGRQLIFARGEFTTADGTYYGKIVTKKGYAGYLEFVIVQ